MNKEWLWWKKFRHLSVSLSLSISLFLSSKDKHKHPLFCLFILTHLHSLSHWKTQSHTLQHIRSHILIQTRNHTYAHTHARTLSFPLSSWVRTHSSVHSSFMSSLLFFFIRVFQIRGLEGLWWLEFRRSRVQVPSDFFSKIGAPFLECYKWFQSMQQQGTQRWHSGTI